jgi:hypothetical protein
MRSPPRQNAIQQAVQSGRHRHDVDSLPSHALHGNKSVPATAITHIEPVGQWAAVHGLETSCARSTSLRYTAARHAGGLRIGSRIESSDRPNARCGSVADDLAVRLPQARPDVVGFEPSNCCRGAPASQHKPFCRFDLTRCDLIDTAGK